MFRSLASSRSVGPKLGMVWSVRIRFFVFFFFFFKVQILREVGNREKRSDHGSQNREV